MNFVRHESLYRVRVSSTWQPRVEALEAAILVGQRRAAQYVEERGAPNVGKVVGDFFQGFLGEAIVAGVLQSLGLDYSQPDWALKSNGERSWSPDVGGHSVKTHRGAPYVDRGYSWTFERPDITVLLGGGYPQGVSAVIAPDDLKAGEVFYVVHFPMSTLNESSFSPLVNGSPTKLALYLNAEQTDAIYDGTAIPTSEVAL